MLESLPVGLREHVSLRNVEAVSTLSLSAQARLAEAIQSGLKRLPRAIEQLRADPDTSITNLLSPPAQLVPEPPIQIDVSTVPQEVADLIQECFPDMPRVSTEALADANVMHAETEQQINPFRERMAVIESLMDQNKDELERALELYLSNQFPKEMLLSRKNELEIALQSLEREKIRLVEVIEDQTLSHSKLRVFTSLLPRLGKLSMRQIRISTSEDPLWMLWMFE